MHAYGTWKMNSLKAELKNRGAKSTGRKDELVERLISYDRNNNFQEDVFNEPENDTLTSSQQTWPLANDFKSVSNTSVKNKLDSVHITDYVIKASGNNAVTVLSLVLRKGYGMMDLNFVSAIVEAQQGNRLFYKSQVNSECTKKLTYFCQLVITEDGDISEGSCECAAGDGVKAACKHITATLYAIHRFNETGVWFIRKTCTEKRQTWHAPKNQKIDISPKKAEQLSFHVAVCDVEKKKTGNLLYDPRREQHKNMPSYQDSIRNAVINFRDHNGKKTFGIAGIYGPACIPSMVNDHDYLERPLQHLWIYNRIKAYSEDAEGIEKRTQDQSTCKEWHEIRSFVVTASHVGEIIHMTDRRNKSKFAEGLVNPIEFSTPATSWGKMQEKAAKVRFEKESHNKVQPCGLFVSKRCPFIGGSPDGLVCVVSLLEIKCPFAIRKEKISFQNLPYLELQNGQLTLKKNSKYYYQVQTQLFVTGREYCFFVIWTLEDYIQIALERDDNVIENEIIPKVTEFYEQYMVPAIAKKYYSC